MATPSWTRAELAPERQSEKRHTSQTDEAHGPNKKAKRPLEDEKVAEDTPLETQQPVGAADCARAQLLLLQTVEDRVLGQSPPRNEDWINETWKVLKVLTELDLTVQVNLTVDALAKWAKLLKTQDAQGVQSRGAALIVEVLACLPPKETGDAVTCTPKDEELALRDEAVATRMQMLGNPFEKNAFERAAAAKHAIECLSSACSANIERLVWVSSASEQRARHNDEMQTTLRTMTQKLMGLPDQCSHNVKQAEQTLQEAKQIKETLSKQLADFVKQRHHELLSAGETEASASLQSVVEVWKADDVEVHQLWGSRGKSDERVKAAGHDLKIANNALVYHQNLSILFHKVRDRREKALQHAAEVFEEVCNQSEERVATALGKYIPMLTRALLLYFEFSSLQQAKAEEQQAAHRSALETHTQVFGDLAPKAKSDIDDRILEASRIKQESQQSIVEIARRQRQLWGCVKIDLPESVRRVLAREFNGLWQQLSGPMKDAMSVFMAAIKSASGGIEPLRELHPVLATTNISRERVSSPFTLATFSSNQLGVVAPPRAAPSTFVAPSYGGTGAIAEDLSGPAELSEKSSTSGWVNVTASSAEARVLSSPLQSPEGYREFAVGSVVYSKMVVGGNCSQFVGGVVKQLLENDMHLVHYDNGDEFAVGSSFLFTKDLMEQRLKTGGARAPNQDTCVERTEGGCSVM